MKSRENGRLPRTSLLIILNSLFIIFLASCTPTAPDLVPTRGETAVISPTTQINPTSIPTTTPSPPPTATLLPTPSPTLCPPGHVISGTFPSAIAGESRYQIYVPPCMENGRLYPTLYMLPGNIHDETIWDEMGLDEAAAQGIAGGILPPMLIVMADGGYTANNTSGGYGSYETVILDDLIPFIEATYAADPANRAIGGLSRGGYWAMEIAFRHPAEFVSVGGHSPALVDCCATAVLNPQYTGLNNNLGDLRIYMDTGRDDYLRTNSIILHEEMEAMGREHTWVLNDGVHEQAYWEAHLAEYLAWYAAGWE